MIWGKHEVSFTRNIIYLGYAILLGKKKKGKEVGADFIYLGALLKSTKPAGFGRIGIKISV